MEALAKRMHEAGFTTEWRLGMGDAASELANMINQMKVDLVIVGGHGHSGISDLIHGTVINHLRHLIQANLLIVQTGGD